MSGTDPGAGQDAAARIDAERKLEEQARTLALARLEIDALRQEVAQLHGEMRDNRNELTRAMRAAESSNRMKSEFLSTAAHELRTPMSSIYGFSQLLLTENFGAEMQKELFGIIFSQSELMVSIINELLDLARIEARQEIRTERIEDRKERLEIRQEDRAAATATRAARIEDRKEARTEKMDQRSEQARERALKEIDRRINALTKLDEKTDDRKRVSAEGKASVDAMVAAEIASLNELRARIAADTSTTSLKANMEAITKSHRVFMLIVPQGHISASADAVKTSVASMTALITKLAARLTEASTAGSDVSAQQKALADAQTKLTTATAAADAALALTKDLKPDNGDKTIADANKKALEAGRAKIKEANDALKGARADIKTATDGTKKLNARATVNATTSVQ